MDESARTSPSTLAPRPSAPRFLAAGDDRFGAHRGLGISKIAFKVTPADGADVLLLENVFHAPGGPPRHLHHDQDEWFTVVDGRFRFEVGDETFELNAGDSLWGPRGVPHVWASTAETGRIVIAFFPAGLMEAFFREVTRTDAMPAQDPELWRLHGMQVMGPPLLGR